MGFQNGPPFRPNVSGIIVLATLSSPGNCLHFGPLSEILGRYFLLTLLSISMNKIVRSGSYLGVQKRNNFGGCILHFQNSLAESGAEKKPLFRDPEK